MRQFRQFKNYRITSNGKVWSAYKQDYLRLTHNNRGYRIVRFQKQGKSHWFCLHTVVAECFLGIRPIGMNINHKDARKENNDYHNLEYVTPSENIQHGLRNGLFPVKEKHYRAKLTMSDVINIRNKRRQGWTYKRLAKKFKVGQTTIGHILHGRSWKVFNELNNTVEEK